MCFPRGASTQTADVRAHAGDERPADSSAGATACLEHPPRTWCAPTALCAVKHGQVRGKRVDISGHIAQARCGRLVLGTSTARGGAVGWRERAIETMPSIQAKADAAKAAAMRRATVDADRAILVFARTPLVACVAEALCDPQLRLAGEDHCARLERR
eukprot:1429819-Prymnesium_polylepis.2